MRNYGFDYLVEKVEVIKEMARPSTTRPEENEKVAKFMKEGRKFIAKKIFEKWSPPSPSKTLNDFIVEALYEEVFKTTYTYSSVEKLFKTLKDTVDGFYDDYLDFIRGGSEDSNKRNQYVLSYLANKIPNKILSQQFLDKITDEEYVKNYRASMSDKAEFRSRAKGYQNKIQSKYSMSADDFATMKAEVSPIIVKINRKSRSLLPAGALQALRRNEKIIISQDTGVNVSEEMVPLDTFVETLMSLVDDVDLVEYYSVNVEEARKTLKILQDRLNNSQPLSKDKIIKNVINRFPEEIAEYLLDEYETDLESRETKGVSEEIIDDQKKAIESVLDIYTPSLLNDIEAKGIITKPEIDIVLKWKDLIQSAENLEKKEVAMNRKQAGLSVDDEYDMDSREDLKALRKYESEKAKEERESKKSSSKNKRKSSNIEDDEDEDEEVGVMSYMAEQVKKDGLLHTIGEYKDRGFKKPVNYHHWLSINS